MPLYEYACAKGHVTEAIRSYARRDECPICLCLLPTTRRFPLPHVEPDGIYSYAPNVGSPEAWEYKQAMAKEGRRIYPKYRPPGGGGDGDGSANA